MEGGARAELVALPDGRALAYSVLGAPLAIAEWVAIYHHGYLSSRLEAAILAEAAAELGCALVAFDRPGYGLSSDDPARTPASVADDVESLLAALPRRVGKVTQIGCSGGAPYAAAAAAALPGRTAALLLIVPFVPTRGREAELTPGMSAGALRTLGHAVARPWLAWATLHAARLLQRVPHGNLLLRAGGFAPVDVAAVAEFPVQAARLRAASHAGLANSINGAARDLHVMAVEAAGAEEDFGRVEAPAAVWAGALDETTPAAMARWWAARLPRARLFLEPRHGHFLSFGLGRRVLASVRAPGAAGAGRPM